MPNINFWELLEIIPAVLLALTFHEAAHGFVAYKLGDTTAKDMGRLTVNPIRHIDLMGLISMIVFRFGWAKPVPVNPRNFRRPRRDMALVAAAGPVSNIILGTLSMILYYIIVANVTRGTFLLSAAEFLILLAVMNIGFAVFNMIPLPPLDGSRILMLILPKKVNAFLFRYERYTQVLLIILLLTGVLTRPLSAIREFLLIYTERFARWIVL